MNESNTLTKEQNPMLPEGIDIKPCYSVNFNSGAFKKLELNSAQKSSMSFLMSQMPTIMASETLSNAYIMKIPEGFSANSLMKYKNGGISNILLDEKGNFTKHAPLYSLTASSAIFAAFSVMSIATGQYFLTRINNELTMINQKIDKVIDFLYGDKKAELMAEISFVQYAYKNYNSIMLHDPQLLATIENLQKSKKVAMKDIEFYLCDLDSKANTTTKKYQEFEELSNEALQIRESLDLSTQLYVMSGLMETYYSQNKDSDYIASLKEDMFYYINKCDKRILSDFSKLNGLNKALSQGKKATDTSVELEQKFENIINELSNGEESHMHKTINTALNTLLNYNGEYYVTKDGDAYIKETS